MTYLAIQLEIPHDNPVAAIRALKAVAGIDLSVAMQMKNQLVDSALASTGASLIKIDDQVVSEDAIPIFEQSDLFARLATAEDIETLPALGSANG